MYNTLSIACLPPDIDEARRFLAAIDPDPDALFGFRSISDRGDDPRLTVKAYGRLDRGTRQSSNAEKDGKPCRPPRLLGFMQDKGAGAFVVISKLDGQGQSKPNVVAPRAFFGDADTRLQVERLHAFIAKSGLAPTVLVASGGVDDGVEKQHGYWRIRGCPVADFTKAQLTLVSRIGTDPAVQDASRVMRLPGFWHLKREPRQTRILSINPAVEYDFREFMSRVLAQPQFCDPWAGGKGTGRTVRRQISGQPAAPVVTGPKARLRVLLDRHGGLITPSVRAMLREAVAPSDGQPGNRHATLVTVVGRCLQARWPDDDIRTLVLPLINSEWADGDWSQHLASIIGWTRAQEASALAAMPAAPSSVAAAFGAGAAR